MNQEKNDRLAKNIRKLISSNLDMNSDDIIKKSLVPQIPSNRRVIALLIFSLIFFLIHYFLLIKDGKIIEKFTDILGSVNDIVVPTFAVIITGYAIFQALVNGSTLINLMVASEDKDEDESQFDKYNFYFFGLSMLYLILMILNFLLIIFFKSVPEDWSLSFLSQRINNILASVLMTIYFTVLLNCLVELKSFVYNLIQCFALNAASTGIEFLEEYKKKKEE
ncbi:hypothetical protein CN918_04085 [Priestia megaterium]|uniref:hypothetical protein n=1 Tax=Priestia megaterium TaxID=1404 RepID=UPI000BF7D608|nr:hypothetical protein [Priestia megaterium]PFI66509.1 hypothetical protein COI68_10175 [Priestia megaterium]PGK58518.1 hypothetical protein CN918_04085 [Priestia megaterium]